MKKQLMAIGIIFIVASFTMCINQATIPNSFFEAYERVEATQNDIDEIFDRYWRIQGERIDYVYETIDLETTDAKRVLDYLDSEIKILEELNTKNSQYSNDIQALFDTVRGIDDQDSRSKATNLVLSLRRSQQRLGDNLFRYESATTAIGNAYYYSAIGADLNDPEIAEAIRGYSLAARTDFNHGDIFLEDYYMAIEEADIIYRQLLERR